MKIYENCLSGCEVDGNPIIGIKSIEIEGVKYSLHDYRTLLSIGNTVNEIVKKTVSLSSDDIINYQEESNERSYWLNHRIANQKLFLCIMDKETMIGHFSMTRVLKKEVSEFINGSRKETEFSVVSDEQAELEKHYVYISAVVVKEAFRKTAMSAILIRDSFNLLEQYIENSNNALGYFAEAYSPQGAGLLEKMGMTNVSGDFFIKENSGFSASSKAVSK